MPNRPMLSFMLLAELGDFVTLHRPCGQLTSDATEPEANGYMVTVGCSCSCGVVFMRWVTPEQELTSWWTNPGLVVFFYRDCAEIYMTLNDGHGGG